MRIRGYTAKKQLLSTARSHVRVQDYFGLRGRIIRRYCTATCLGFQFFLLLFFALCVFLRDSTAKKAKFDAMVC